MCSSVPLPCSVVNAVRMCKLIQLCRCWDGQALLHTSSVYADFLQKKMKDQQVCHTMLACHSCLFSSKHHAVAHVGKCRFGLIMLCGHGG